MIAMMKKWIIILVIFMVSIPVAFAADLGDLIPGEEKEPTVIIIREGSTAITDSLSAKSAPEKTAILTTVTSAALKDVKYPYPVSGTEITIDNYKCNAEICGYWIHATRGGKEVYTNSPIWISPPPYEVVVSDIFDEKTNTQTITLKEDPKLAAEQVLQGYVDRQPLGKAVSYER